MSHFRCPLPRFSALFQLGTSDFTFTSFSFSFDLITVVDEDEEEEEDPSAAAPADLFFDQDVLASSGTTGSALEDVPRAGGGCFPRDPAANTSAVSLHFRASSQTTG